MRPLRWEERIPWVAWVCHVETASRSSACHRCEFNSVDSYYEYLIKQHLLVGGATEQYSEMYTSAIETARKALFMPVTNYPGRDYLVRFASSLVPDFGLKS
jgi:hypothetical protein